MLFALAASSVMSGGGELHNGDEAIKVAEEISEARRITTKGVLNVT